MKECPLFGGVDPLWEFHNGAISMLLWRQKKILCVLNLSLDATTKRVKQRNA